jgi:hypothetical protein
MAEVSFKDKVTGFITGNSLWIIGGLVVAVIYLAAKMKKRNIKIFGR